MTEDINMKIKTMEYHIQLLSEMLKQTDNQFSLLVIEKKLSEEETSAFMKLCERLSTELEEQKAEGYLYFQPLFDKFSDILSTKMTPVEVVNACLKQQMFVPLMSTFKEIILSKSNKRG